MLAAPLTDIETEERHIHVRKLAYSIWLYRFVRLVLAGAFILAGALKLAEPESFASIIGAFGLLPKPLVPWAAIVLPVVEVLSGIGLLLEVRGSLGTLAGLLVLFMAVLLYGLHLGLNVDCGCYGPGDPQAGTFSSMKAAVFRDLGLMAMAAYMYWRRRCIPSDQSDILSQTQ